MLTKMIFRGDNMSVVIVGGNERMERQYADLCKEYSCKAKVFTKIKGSMRNIGNPDLIILFTNTVQTRCRTKCFIRLNVKRKGRI